MKTHNKHPHNWRAVVSIICFMVVASNGQAEGKNSQASHWVVGLYSAMEVQSENPLQLLPWVSYDNSWLSADLEKIVVRKNLNRVTLHGGIAIDYDAIEQNEQQAPLLQTGFSIQLNSQFSQSNQARFRINDLSNAWQSAHSIEHQWLLDQGSLGVVKSKVGIQLSSIQWNQQPIDQRTLGTEIIYFKTIDHYLFGTSISTQTADSQTTFQLATLFAWQF